MAKENYGLRRFISYGNASGLDESDFIELKGSHPFLNLFNIDAVKKAIAGRNKIEAENYEKSRNNVEELQNVSQYFKDKAIEDLLEKHFKKAGKKEKEYIKNELESELYKHRTSDTFDGELYMDLIKGVDGFKTKFFWSKIKKVLDYAWFLLIKFSTLAVVLAIYDVVYKDFEVVVASISILIYVSLTGFIQLYTFYTDLHRIEYLNEFNELKKMIKPNYAYEIKEKELLTSINKINKGNVKILINLIFNSIIYLIAIFHLLSLL